jgi:hypothetical protein
MFILAVGLLQCRACLEWVSRATILAVDGSRVVEEVGDVVFGLDELFGETRSLAGTLKIIVVSNKNVKRDEREKPTEGLDLLIFSGRRLAALMAADSERTNE